MSDPQELLDHVLELWDRANRGELTTKELRTYESLVKIFNMAAGADLSMAQAQSFRTKTAIESDSYMREQAALEEGSKPLALVDGA